MDHILAIRNGLFDLDLTMNQLSLARDVRNAQERSKAPNIDIAPPSLKALGLVPLSRKGSPQERDQSVCSANLEFFAFIISDRPLLFSPANQNQCPLFLLATHGAKGFCQPD